MQEFDIECTVSRDKSDNWVIPFAYLSFLDFTLSHEKCVWNKIDIVTLKKHLVLSYWVEKFNIIPKQTSTRFYQTN